MDTSSCPRCRAPAGPGASFCATCGASLTPPPPPPPVIGPLRPAVVIVAVAVAATVGLLVGLMIGGRTTDTSTAQPAVTTVTTTPAPTTTATTTTTTIPAVWPRLDWDRAPKRGAEFDGEAYQGMWAVTAGGPGWVGVGYEELGAARNAVVWTSPDGTAWSRVAHDDALFAGHRMYGVTAGGPGLVAVGWEWDGGDRHAVAWTSPDGQAWTRAPVGDGVPGWRRMFAVTNGGPGLVAVGDVDGDAAVWTSTDGSAWTRVTGHEDAFADAVMWGVAAGPSGLVAVGQRYGPDGLDADAAIWTSTDGLAWTRADGGSLGGANGQGAYGVTAFESGFVAVGADWSQGDAAGAVWTSPDGVAWFRADPALADLGGGVIHGVAEAGPGLVAVGWAGADTERGAVVWASPDGSDWRRMPGDGFAAGERMYGIAVVDGAVVAVGHMGVDDADAAAWASGLGETTTPPAAESQPDGDGSGIGLLMLASCDPRTEPDYCGSDYSYHRAFDGVVAGLGADLDYGVPATAADLAAHDAVIANFCGLPPGTGLVDLLTGYLDDGGAVLALGDSFCMWGGTTSGETATLLTGSRGITITPLAASASPEVATEVAAHPATVSVASVFVSARDVLEVASPAETIVEASFGPWVAVAEAGGRLAAVPDTGFFWDIRDWYPEAADTDTIALWHSLLAWLAGAAG